MPPNSSPAQQGTLDASVLDDYVTKSLIVLTQLLLIYILATLQQQQSFL